MKHYEANSLIRKLLGISQQQIADYLGCTKQTISNYEHGKTKTTWIYKLMNKAIDEYLEMMLMKCSDETIRGCCFHIESEREEL